MSHDHGGGCHGPTGGAGVLSGQARIALVGSPNAGKTSVFNGLTGLNAKTGNYPGVTVSRYVGTLRAGATQVVLEDLPGTYSLDPISPDEEITVGVLDGSGEGLDQPDAVLVVLDATTLRRSLPFLAQVLARGLPTCAVVTFTDELGRRGGTLDVERLAQALGIPALAVIGHRGGGLARLREQLADWRSWDLPPVPPPDDPEELDAWASSVLSFAGFRSGSRDKVTQRIDAVLLHPVAGTVVFLAVMLLFFQTIFTLAAPLQGWIETEFGRLSGWVHAHVGIGWLAGLLGDAVIGGVGGVLAFVPQIMLLFLLIAVLEGVGYMSRAAFLMDRVMAKAGLEGRAFVALLSSVACAIPGIMATRTLPSARDRLATMMAAPLMTCSARIPVYVLLIGVLVDPHSHWGPFGAQGLIMFGLYLLGAVSAMLAAWTFKKLGNRNQPLLPFHMEMPPYRLPSARSVLLAMTDSARAFLRKCSTIIVAATVILWLLLNLPAASDRHLTEAGVDRGDDAAVAAYVIDHSYGAHLGRAVSPVFAPLGFDWRINIGVLSAQAARETFVATLGQVASATDPEHPARALSTLTRDDGPDKGRPLFTAGTIAALLVYFAFAMQCMATIGVLRRETGTWRWPLIAFGYLTTLAWIMAFLAHTAVTALAG
ncbi:ferrous iron transporter B [Actinomadura nitritigenes]|uniref:ferrous iron transporter B n=1 Tax=Actinomadura nitritigenes TaxID=134602 RepID=UPI003D8C3F70